MPFAITVANLKDSMETPGCPICSIERRAAQKAVDVFLYENLMDHSLRDKALAANGYCPPHTRLLVATELSNSGAPLGVNILYEVLDRRIARELKAIANRPSGFRFVRDLLAKLGILLKPAPVLAPAGPCPICDSAFQAALNSLSALFEELERKTPDILQAYQASDGLCLAHLRLGIQYFGKRHTQAAHFLANLAANRLLNQADHMKEFIRKKNWEYRDENLTPEEAVAWRDTLTFFTGYPGESFTHLIEET